MTRKSAYADGYARSGLAKYMEAFLDWGLVTGLSEDTQTRRKNAIRRFISWCDDRDIQRPQDITRPILERYQRHLFLYRKEDGQPLTWGTQNVMLTPIKSWFRWLTRENHILSNPASEMIVPKKPRSLPKSILTEAEIQSIMAQPNTNTAQGVRDRAMLETLYSTGIRRAELSALDVFDVDNERETLLIREGKGMKDRVVPIGREALNWIKRYQMEVREGQIAGRDDGALFLNRWGQRYARSALGSHIKKYMVRAGVNKAGSCHLFRHTCATHMLEHGADIRYIQALLGHANLDTTQIYTRVSIEKLKAIHQATHPGNQRP